VSSKIMVTDWKVEIVATSIPQTKNPHPTPILLRNVRPAHGSWLCNRINFLLRFFLFLFHFLLLLQSRKLGAINFVVSQIVP